MMRNRQKQRELRRAGIRKERSIEEKNRGQYHDPTPYKAVEKIRKEQKKV